ncbi:hypothetical protein LK994_06570 [Ferruginibacter lapsinanis]|uniref:hypothetical protein n=1 Tax=Ferruginibacter lapsinanis TaxID=563172 RepID=UPI001E3D47AE|nr:hypothetical protein [Ferruginibacter lapsinanis]UEG51136.1 hypothetical protein LK994_06570 [Ferruginibacter lapsinanis]
MKKRLFTAFICLLSGYVHAQSAYPLKISCQKNVTNDTVWLTVVNPIQQKPGTLLVTAYQTTAAKTDSFYLPVIDTINYYGIVIPANYQKGTLKLRAAFFPKIFEVSGMVLNRTNSETINALLITKNQRIYNKTIKLTDDKQFTLPGLIFENRASLVFNYTLANKKDKPNILIKQSPSLKDFTDSTFSTSIILQEDTPVSMDTVTAHNDTKKTTGHDKNKSVLLKEVTVTAIKKSRAEKFNKEFSTGLFNDGDERVVDCLDNNDILSYPDCISFLRSRIAGLTTTISRFGESEVVWRGKTTQAFYIDEMEVDLDQILNINVADIAIVKAYPPPFWGATGGTGDGGAIAIYTRRGEYQRENAVNNRWLFPITGYSPAIHILFDGK